MLRKHQLVFAFAVVFSLTFSSAGRAASDAQLIRAGKFEQAKVELERDLKTNESAASHCNLGIALLRLRNYRPALDHLIRATTLEPTLTPAWLNLAACYICLNEFDRAIGAYRKVENLMPQSKPALDQLIDFLSKAGGTDETAPDYGQRTWKHWTKDGAGIRVYVEHHPRYRDMAIAQLKELARVAQLQVTIVDKKPEAQFVVEWINPPSETMLLERGATACVARNGNIVGAVVQISIANESGFDFLSDDTVKKTCSHEFMHALGVAGHSSNVQDIMFPMIELPTVELRLTDRDKATLRRLYSNT
jgi:hypothetical protein